MNSKVVFALALFASVVAAAVSGVVVMNKREAVARAAAARAESEEATAASEAKKARADESAELARAAAKENEAKAAAEDRQAKEAERETEKLALQRAKEEKAKAAADAETAKAKANEAADLRAAEKAKADAEKAIAEAARLAAQAEADKAKAVADALEAERIRSEAVVAEARLLELRKIDFETIERDLIEYRQELDEREAALRPEKTAADLAWVGDREADIIGGDTNRVRRASKPLPENDVDLPRETRILARAERLRLEDDAVLANVSSNALVSALERLYLQAVREDRVVDAQYYLKNIKMHYPNWRYKPSAVVEAKKEEVQ